MDVSKLNERKKELGITFDELAKKSGVPKRTIVGVFRGYVQTPRVDTVEAIERALGLRDGGLQETAREEISPQEYRLLSAFRSVDAVTRELVIALFENVGRR